MAMEKLDMNQVENLLQQLTDDEQAEYALAQILENINFNSWTAGDIINTMNNNEMVLDRIASDKGVNVGTLRGYSRTAEAFPMALRKELFQNETWMKFTHFKYLAPLMVHKQYGPDIVLNHIKIMGDTLHAPITTRDMRRYIETEIKGNMAKSTYKTIADDVIKAKWKDGKDCFLVDDLIAKKPIEIGKAYRVIVKEILNPDETNL
jgi:hypothetical protein